jgi:hypothetical protein
MVFSLTWLMDGLLRAALQTAADSQPLDDLAASGRP